MKKSWKIILIFFTVAVSTATVCYLFLINGKQEQVKDFARYIKEKNYVQLLFVGDLMFDRGIRYYAEKNGGNDFIFEKISQTLLENDIVVANLEGPITNNKSVSSGTMPGSTENYFFTFSPSLPMPLFKNNIRIVNLGNNHILNFGYDGLYATEKYLDNYKIGYFGSPNGPKSVSTEIGGVKITFVGYNEFSTIQEVEEQSTIEEIGKAKKYSDIIVIFSHWGVEYSKLPTKNQERLARKFIDNGADLVIGSHSHVMGAVEEYKNKKIYYSLGNFIFDQYFDEDVRNGLGVVVKIDKQTKDLSFSEKHFYLENNGQTVLK